MNSQGLAHIWARADKFSADEQRRQKLLPVAFALRDPNIAPAIIEEARIQIQKWRDKKLCSPYYIESWAAMLDVPERAAQMLEDKSKKANQMRQNSPFVSAVRRYQGGRQMQAKSLLTDKILESAKRKEQERDRAVVRSGQRSQESMFLFAPSIVKTMKVRHRVVDFD